MNALERLTEELPPSIVADLRAVVAKRYAQYENRDRDYFEQKQESGIRLYPEERGTEEWKAERAANRHYSEDSPWGDCWLSEFTGDDRPPPLSQLNHFPTFADAIRQEFEETLYDYIKGDMEDEEFSEFLAEHHDEYENLIAVCATEFSDRPESEKEFDSLKEEFREAAEQIEKAVNGFPPAWQPVKDSPSDSEPSPCFTKAIDSVERLLKGEPPQEEISPWEFKDAIAPLDHRNDDPDGRLTALLTAGKRLAEAVKNAREHLHAVDISLGPETASSIAAAKKSLEGFRREMNEFWGGNR